jgi:hypothetical protein
MAFLRMLKSRRGQGPWLLASAVVLAVVVSPFAIAAGEGQPVRGGARNPSNNESQAYTRETQVIANNGTYGTRQSNKGAGGGAIYGCRSAVNANPCLRGVNLEQGQAFQFATGGATAGQITAGNGGDQAKPFTTNATGVATGLNADRVDGLNGSDLQSRFAIVAANGTLGGNRGATAVRRINVGDYQVDFDADVSKCAYTATEQQLENAGAVAVQAVDADTIAVRTRAGGGSDGNGPTDQADRPFHLQVTC